MQPVYFYTGLQLRAQLFVVVLGLLVLLFVLNQVRRKKIREEYSLLWILSGVILVLSATFIKSVERLAGLHEAQLLAYMRVLKIPKGLLMNFNSEVLKDGIKRRVL